MVVERARMGGEEREVGSVGAPAKELTDYIRSTCDWNMQDNPHLQEAG